VVASETLLIPCRVQQSHIASFLKLVEGVLSCGVIVLLVVGSQPWGSIFYIGWEHSLGFVD
jgi:hypothetical protein